MAFAHEKKARLESDNADSVYEKPAIIAEGRLSVRAGSTTGGGTARGSEDDADLFTEPDSE